MCAKSTRTPLILTANWLTFLSRTAFIILKWVEEGLSCWIPRIRNSSDHKCGYLSLEVETVEVSSQSAIASFSFREHIFQPTQDFLHSFIFRATFLRRTFDFGKAFGFFFFSLLMMKILPSRSRLHLCKSPVALWWTSVFFPQRLVCLATSSLFLIPQCFHPMKNRLFPSIVARFTMIIYYCFSDTSASFRCLVLSNNNQATCYIQDCSFHCFLIAVILILLRRMGYCKSYLDNMKNVSCWKTEYFVVKSNLDKFHFVF